MPDTTSPVAATPTRLSALSPDGLLLDMWYFAASSDEMKPGQHFRREILGEPVLLGRGADGVAFAIRDICPHRAAPLSAGRQVQNEGQTTVECPYHGWRFGGDGQCKHMPSLVTGQEFDVGRVRVRRYPIHEAQGLVHVFMAADPRFDGTPDMPPPHFPDAMGTPKLIVHRIFKSHMDHAVVGLMDPAHVPFVHSQWWWRPPSAGLREKTKLFEPREMGWAMARHEPSGNSLGYKLIGGKPSTEIVFKLPGFRWEDIRTPKTHVFTLTCLTPENGQSTRITQISWWEGLPVMSLFKPLFRKMALEFLDQDGRMVNLQNEGLKYQPNLMFIDDIDVQAKWYQKLKREWVASRAENRPFANTIEARNLSWRS